MSTYLIDFENVKSAGLAGIDHIRRYDSVHLFWSTRENKISIEMMEMIRASESEIVMHKAFTGDRDALDHQLCSYLGFLAGATDEKSFVIVSNDKAYDHLIEFWKVLDEGIQIQRVPEISRISEAPENDPALIEAAREAAEAVFERERHYEETHGRYGRRKDRSGRYLKTTRSRLNRGSQSDSQTAGQEDAHHTASQTANNRSGMQPDKAAYTAEAVPEEPQHIEETEVSAAGKHTADGYEKSYTSAAVNHHAEEVQEAAAGSTVEPKSEESEERSSRRRQDNIRGRKRRQGRNSRHQNADLKNEVQTEEGGAEAAQETPFEASENKNGRLIEDSSVYELEKSPAKETVPVIEPAKAAEQEPAEIQTDETASVKKEESVEKAVETEQKDSEGSAEDVAVTEAADEKAAEAEPVKQEEQKLRRPVAAVVVTGFRSGIVVESGFTADGILDKPTAPKALEKDTVSKVAEVKTGAEAEKEDSEPAAAPTVGEEKADHSAVAVKASADEQSETVTESAAAAKGAEQSGVEAEVIVEADEAAEQSAVEAEAIVEADEAAEQSAVEAEAIVEADEAAEQSGAETESDTAENETDKRSGTEAELDTVKDEAAKLSGKVTESAAAMEAQSEISEKAENTTAEAVQTVQKAATEVSEESAAEEAAEKSVEAVKKRRTEKSNKTSENGKKRTPRRKKQTVKQEASETEASDSEISDNKSAEEVKASEKKPAAEKQSGQQGAFETDKMGAAPEGEADHAETSAKNKATRPRRGRPPKKDKPEVVSEKKAVVTEADVIEKYPEAAQAAWTKDLVKVINSSKDKKELYAATVKLLGQENGRTIYHEIKVLK